jgi:hypothetical protein
VATKVGPGRQRKSDPRNHRNGGQKTQRMEPQGGLPPDRTRAVQGFNLTETTGECVCSTEAQDTAKHVMEGCEEQGRRKARRRWRRRQEAMGGPVLFKVTAQTSEEEVKNFNKFAEEVRMEEELEA